MINFFHKLMNPHCPDCLAESVCETCEVLRRELELERINNQKLLQTIIDFHSPKPIAEIKEDVELRPVSTPRLGWNARRQLLEQEDLAKLKLEQSKRAELTQTTEELEAELGIKDASKNS